VNGLKTALGIHIRIGLDPDLFCQIRILERAMADYSVSFEPRSQIEI
jgi:hypothetical protein